MNSSVNRALIFQGGGPLGAYEAGYYMAAVENILEDFRTEERNHDPVFHTKFIL